MVREANMKQAASEKQLKEARGKVRPHLPPSPARPAFLPHQTLAWPGGACRGGHTEAQKGEAEVSLLLKFRCTTEILLGLSRGWEILWSLPFLFPFPAPLYKAGTSAWLCQPGQIPSVSELCLSIYDTWGLGCSRLPGAQPVPRHRHLTECWLSL